MSLFAAKPTAAELGSFKGVETRIFYQSKLMCGLEKEALVGILSDPDLKIQYSGYSVLLHMRKP